MNVDDEGAAGAMAPPTRARHIGKRALKNKSVTISFDEKDLKDFVTGFHKRKKKRRKEAQKQQEESLRRKRIEARKKRKLEEMMVAGLGEETEDGEADEEDAENGVVAEPDASTSGTTMYDTGELKVTVTTSEISREEDVPVRREKTQSTESGSTAKASSSQPAPLRKSKPSKQNRRKSSTKTMKKRDKKKQARGIKSTR
ncbi:Ribosomal RNA-processing protein [Hirschfeldia incana]|nr:Ribosomal RNA-processing protein [Hirschfeldia incana]